MWKFLVVPIRRLGVFLPGLEFFTVFFGVLGIPCAKLPGSNPTNWGITLPMKKSHTAIKRIIFFMFLIFKLLMIGDYVCFPQAA